MTDAAATRAVVEAITSRHSIRRFLPTPVPRATIEEILAVAARAPSGTNTQPWNVYVLTGASLASLSARLVAAYDDPVERARHTEEYAYYPTEWRSPFIERRRKVGWDLYGLLGIAKTDKARMHAQHRRNFEFFGAPANEQLVCGMSLGHRDPDAVENTLVTEREPVASFARFLD